MSDESKLAELKNAAAAMNLSAKILAEHVEALSESMANAPAYGVVAETKEKHLELVKHADVIGMLSQKLNTVAQAAVNGYVAQHIRSEDELKALTALLDEAIKPTADRLMSVATGNTN